MKRKWIKRIIAAAVSVSLISGVAVAAGCAEDTTEYTVTYSYNYDGATTYTTQTVEEGGTATKPQDPTRDGYTFDAWYTEAECTNEVDFTAAITADVTYYAGWNLDALTVTFVLYDSETLTVQVNPGETVSQPDEPTRDGYLFSGWYADSSLEEAFDFSSPITQDTTVYASWIETDGDHVIVTYMWNYEGADVYSRVSVEKGTYLTTLPEVEREGYKFIGWYLDEECETVYRAASYGALEDNLTLYACWYYGNVFEAEYTNLYDEYDEPREFYGYSENVSGEMAIAADSTGTASNGYFVGCMYRNGSYIYFDIESDRDVTDAVLTISLSLGIGYGSSATFTPETYSITVNGSAVSYSAITIEYVTTGTLQYTAFAEYTLGTISLNEGSNTIRIEVTNSNRGEGGTQNATAPLVDCITIYTNALLTWDPITSNIANIR